MSWKCVLVGLALVLPGILLVVEGRLNGGNRESAGDGQIFDSLLKYLRKKELSRERYDSSDQGVDPAPEKKEDTDASRVLDVQQSEDGLVPNYPSPASQGGSQNSGEQGSHKELNAVANEPHALPISQKQHQTQGHKSGAKDVGFFASNTAFIMIVAGCTVLAAVGIVGAGVCWYKYHKGAKATSVVEYPAYGVTGPTKDRLPSPGDRKLAQSAQMYHYQHQKQQMIAMEKANGNMKHDASDDESEEDTVEGDYTVYECPGLAPTGEMEVKNPLFRGDETPSTPANEDSHPPQEEN